MSKKEVKVEMKNGTTMLLRELTEKDLPNVKLAKDEKGIFLTMKSVVLKKDNNYEYERRLYKWRSMPTIVMYTLKKPLNMSALKAVASDQEIFDLAVEQYTIKKDKENSGEVSQKSPEERLDIIVKNLMALGASREEAEATVAQTRKDLKAKGFLNT